MPRTFEKSPVILPIVCVIEASQSMCTARVARITEMIKRMKTRLLEKYADPDEVCVRIAVVKYADTAKLVTDGFENLEDLSLPEIEAEGEANVANLLDLLTNKLLSYENITGFSWRTMGVSNARIVFFSASPSTEDYTEKLKEAKGNNCFRFANKIAVTLCGECDKAMLLNISENEHNIIPMTDFEDTWERYFENVEPFGSGRMPAETTPLFSVGDDDLI